MQSKLTIFCKTFTIANFCRAVDVQTDFKSAYCSLLDLCNKFQFRYPR